MERSLSQVNQACVLHGAGSGKERNGECHSGLLHLYILGCFQSSRNIARNFFALLCFALYA